MSLDEEWLNFQTSTTDQDIQINDEVTTPKEMPKCSDI